MQKDNYNPDVLTCLANLSSDEVFTPPQVANDILDLLPKELWSNPQATFLDPVCKTGVFLREIAKRLNAGLEKQIPDKQQRINHIFTNQLFGLAITELTALLSRRSVYCSKAANGKYSVCTGFDSANGNIVFERMEHTWENGHCMFCGASQENYERSEELESHAYSFIHTDKPEEIFKMKFDVIIGNPPYQLSDGGGTGSSATPLYNSFIMQAKRLNPRYLSMIIPSRWFSGGKGLDDFRKEMLSDNRIRQLVDYTDSRDCFPGVDIAGGICYFLWDRDNRGECTVSHHDHGKLERSMRRLDQFDIFVRSNISISIINKVQVVHVGFYVTKIVSTRNPFGLDSKIRPSGTGELILHWSGGKGPFKLSEVPSGHALINKWKVLLSKASFDHGGQPDKQGSRRIFSRVEVLGPHDVCTDSYLIVGAYITRQEAENLATFLRAKFCRYLVSTVLHTQNIARDCFQFVPLLSMQNQWTDIELFQKFGLSPLEIQHIESKIRPMETNGE
jgi:site-specific DNA-methyltransferase (adenine-specific)